MHLPRPLISKLYLHLQKTRHALAPPVLILVALEPDALCACRILTRLLKHDYIPHKIQPVAGYADLERVGRELVSPMMETRGGSGGVVVCLGVGGTVDLGVMLGLEPDEEDTGSSGTDSYGGVEVWVIDSHRPWNLGNVFGGHPLEPETAGGSKAFSSRAPPGVSNGCISHAYKPSKGGIIVFDDGDIEESLEKEREAYMSLVDMPDVEDNGENWKAATLKVDPIIMMMMMMQQKRLPCGLAKSVNLLTTLTMTKVETTTGQHKDGGAIRGVPFQNLHDHQRDAG
ncbi:hypothetical protein MCOR02_002381 [Pyricularia oryzae]|nr:hypothetical protein MCOR02_002381 [Pyricularia oryzae]